MNESEALNKRRDEIALELGTAHYGDADWDQLTYKWMNGVTRLAIDRIIELEGGAA